MSALGSDSCVTSSHITSASKSLGVKVKGSIKSSHSIVTQPPAMPVSAVGQDLPISYFNEDDNMAEFMDPTVEVTHAPCMIRR